MIMILEILAVTLAVKPVEVIPSMPEAKKRTALFRGFLFVGPICYQSSHNLEIPLKVAERKILLAFRDTFTLPIALLFCTSKVCDS